MSRLPFTRLLHADWSCRPQGRWAAEAVRKGDAWSAGSPRPVGDLPAFVDDLVGAARERTTLAGFDFPIGLPVAYAARTTLSDFPSALDVFGTGIWADFYAVAETQAEIGLHRPFYPQQAGSRGTVSHRHLLDGHGVAGMANLTRRCEHRSADGGRAASCMFWTIGAAAVGKAALAGWREVIAPARARGARLWPFDGGLDALGKRDGLTLCETYPADVYARLGAGFGAGESKRRQSDRAGKAVAIVRWAQGAGVELGAGLQEALHDGFGPSDRGGDAFDALVGLLGMIAVVDGTRPDGAPAKDDVRRWEGWILGRGGGALGAK